MVSSEAQEICEKNQKKTMMPEQIVEALKVRLTLSYISSLSCMQTLGFEKYVADVESATDEVKTKAKVSSKSALVDYDLLLFRYDRPIE